MGQASEVAVGVGQVFFQLLSFIMNTLGLGGVGLAHCFRNGCCEGCQLLGGPALGIDEVAGGERGDGFFRKAVSFVQHIEALLRRRQDFAATHREVSKQQVVIDHDDGGFLHAFASLDLGAVAERRAGAIQAAVTISRDVFPDIIGDTRADVAVTVPMPFGYIWAIARSVSIPA